MESKAGAQAKDAADPQDVPEEGVVDTDEEEDMENDDYYKVGGCVACGKCALDENDLCRAG